HKFLAVIIQPAVLLDVLVVHIGVSLGLAAEPFELLLARRLDPQGDGCTWFAGSTGEELVMLDALDMYHQVDPVKQRTGNLLGVARYLRLAAPAIAHRIIGETAGAGVLGGDHHEP